MRSIYSDNRKSGISLIGEVPWGTSFCQFYQTQNDLLENLVPYFKAGLENNESCIWITSALLDSDEAQKALKKAIPDFKQYTENGQMEIISYHQWRTGGEKSGKAIISRLDKAIFRGFDGVRLAFNALPKKKNTQGLASFGEDASISRNNILVAVAFPRDEFDAIGLMEVVKNHRFALVRNADKWEVIESSEATIARDALRRSEEKLHSLFLNMAEGFAYHRILLDSQGRPCDYIFLEMNDAFERLTGLKGDNILGKRVTEILPGIQNDPTDWIGKYGKVALTGHPLHFESYSEALDRWYSVSAFSPHIGFFAVTFSDITERKKAEDSLKINNERLEILSEATGLLLSSDTPEKIVQTIACRVMVHLECDCFFNFIADEEAGKLRLNAYAGVSEEVAKGLAWLNYGEAICGCAAQDGCRIISENVQENGDMRAALVRSFGVQAYASHPLKIGIQTIGTLSFGTRSRTHFSEAELELMKTVAEQVSVAMQRRRVEEALRQRTLELEASNKELESFSYTVSHDLRAPLRAMDGFSQALLEDYLDKLDEQGQDWLNNIRASSQMMAQLIDALLGLSRVVRAELRLQNVNLSDMALSVVKELQVTQPERKVEFLIAPGLETYGDINLLRIALTNLLGNAFKFTAKCANARIEFGLTDLDKQRYYFVKDNGAGFDMTYAGKLFKAFQRLHSANDFPGTGIGLATAQRIVQRHGGKILAQGEIGKGATFYFSLAQEGR